MKVVRMMIEMVMTAVVIVINYFFVMMGDTPVVSCAI